MEVQETKTAKLVEALKNNGFKAEMFNSYSNSYNQDYNYLCITVREAKNKLAELFELCKDFEIVLGKYANEKEPVFFVRKNRRFAELVEQEGINYDLLNRRETTSIKNCTVLTNEDWINFYNKNNK